MSHATFLTTETFEPGIEEDQIKGEVELRLKAMAITSNYTGNVNDGWELITRWNIIGQQ